jgi:hypothetical protein
MFAPVKTITKNHSIGTKNRLHADIYPITKRLIPYARIASVTVWRGKAQYGYSR